MNNVFIRRSELQKTENKINKNDIKNMIPAGSLKEKDNIKKSHMIEFRWKLYNIKDIGTYIEISKKYPGKNRVFLNKYGKWIETYVSKQYSIYCTEKHYYYTDK